MSPSSHSFYDDSIPLLLLLLALFMTTTLPHHLPAAAAPQADELLRRCYDTCGGVQVPYPFYVASSPKCGPPPSEAFRLFCNGSVNHSSSDVFFSLRSRSYRVLRFFSDGLLLDFPNSSASACRRYADLASFGFFAGNIGDFFGISTDNVFDLYGCEDSSICRADCGGAAACDGGRPGCCFPLSDRAGWTGFSMFRQLGCRGFSSWVVSPDGKGGSEKGIKVEWAIPRNYSKQICGPNAKIIAASSVISGVRCQCEDGFAGDGFASGVGCLKSCFKEGKEVYGQDCYAKPHRPTKTKILVGVVTSTLTIASLTALFCLLRRPPIKDHITTFDPENIHHTQTNIISFQVFNYSELEEATGGFSDAQILCHGGKGILYAGTLLNASPIAVHKIQCDGERDLLQTLSAAERISAVLHRNLARPLGCSVGSGHTLLVVYAANGTLKDHLRRHDEIKKIGGLDWCDRLGVVAETASVLAFLQCEISPPIFHHNLRSGYIFLDEDWSAHVSGFELLYSQADEDDDNEEEKKKQGMSDVYNLGLVLLEIIMGADEHQLSGDHRHQYAKLALQKMRSGKLEEIVDVRLNYHDQTPSKQEEIEIVADLATRCLLFSGDGKIHMADVARELLHLTNKDAGRRKRGRSASALEETFSNSSLLQMISMSPDSIFIPSAAARGFS